MKGRIHSIETMGLVDGPGIRFVSFFQGCDLRCAYCHNPDTWSMEGGCEYTAEELLSKAKRFRPYFEKSKGGVTCSGGEALLQPEFLLEYFKLCKAEGIHTALDTSGFGKGMYEEILRYTDLVLLDIKHSSDEGYKSLTGLGIERYNEFANALESSAAKVWVRHVVVPGITDSMEHMKRIREMAHRFKNLQRIELLPYHVLGVEKYKQMGISYRLEGVEPMSEEKTMEMEKYINK